MNNGWRTALLGIWIILLVSAVVLFGGGLYLQGQAVEASDVAMAGRGALLFAIAWACLSGTVLFLLTWIVVSANVREHDKDRELLRKLLAR
uniref:Uncharacterized protein n=1 Tax=Neobacillus citreus TaxID=2833578 RepID=A0A942T0K5_9BACI